MKITITDVRRAINYLHDVDVNDFTDEQLLRADFLKDLGMGNIRVINVFLELQRTHGIVLPVELFRQMEDNTVASFIKAVNLNLPE